MTYDYFLQTGDVDRERLTILSELYNPAALSFLIDSGLKPGMTVLEVGCGTGHMACDLAVYLGPNGKVIAIDSSTKQIEVCKQTADEKGVDNIEFLVMDVMKLADLNQEYDATYGKWVVEFLENPKKALSIMYQFLKPGGIFAYETSNMKQSNYFSSPYNPAVELWHSYGPRMFEEHGCHLTFAYDDAYPLFCELGCSNIKLRVNQAVLSNAREKSVYRLGLISSTSTLLNKNILTQDEIDDMEKQLIELEGNNTITGFYHNILISGIKK